MPESPCFPSRLDASGGFRVSRQSRRYGSPENIQSQLLDGLGKGFYWVSGLNMLAAILVTRWRGTRRWLCAPR